MPKFAVSARLAAVIVGCVFAVAGCEPAVSPVQSHPLQGTPAPVQTWQVLNQSVLLSDQANTYTARYHVHLKRAGVDDWWWGKSSIQRPDGMSMYVDSDRVAFAYFQSGETAYVHDAPLWHKTEPMPSIDMFTSYLQLIQRAGREHLPIVRLPRKRIGNESCDVYRATIPGQWLKPIPSWQNYRVEGATGNVSITFYVGTQSHRLRFVETVSASTASQTGPAEVDTNIEFSGFDAPASKVTMPPSLARQLGRQIP